MSSSKINTITIISIFLSCCDAQKKFVFNQNVLSNIKRSITLCGEELYSNSWERQKAYDDIFTLIFPGHRITDDAGCVMCCAFQRMGIFKEGMNEDHSLKVFQEFVKSAGAPEKTADMITSGAKMCFPKLNHNDDAGNCVKCRDTTNCFKNFLDGLKFS